MNYYERHLGDYAKDTGHLSMLEHGAYTLLLDRYYGTEQGIQADQAHRIARARTREEREAVDTVLAEFFVLSSGFWTHSRVEGEIEKAHGKISAARQNGKKGGRPKKAELTHEKPSGLLLGSVSETQAKALQSPVSSLQIPKEEIAPSELADSAETAKPPPPAKPPDFDGKNAEVLNGKSVVALAVAWELPETWGVDAEALGWKPGEVLTEAERFRQYWTSGKGSGTRRAVKGWRQSWSNWLGKAAERKR